jgi:hypothetical protein
MATHRLPGMSISIEHWDALGERAAALGTTRTELIRRAIERTVTGDGDHDLVRELDRAQRQLAAIRQALGLTEQKADVAA